MIPFLSISTSSPPSVLQFPLLTHFKSPSHRTHRFSIFSLPNNSFQQPITNTNGSSDINELPAQPQLQPRTVFPGGYKRPEIKVPNFVLQVNPDDVLMNGSENDALDLIDKAVSKYFGIVVLNGDGSSSTSSSSSGKMLYEAACLLKSIVKDRAYFLISERVDIASAVDASGVVLSDQGLPSIVARNMMMTKSESVVLPLVGRTVQTPRAAFNASNSEGADFLIYAPILEEHFNLKIYSAFADVKIPIFVLHPSSRAVTKASELLKSGAGGLVLSLEELRQLNDESLSQLFNSAVKKSEDELVILNNNESLYIENDVNGKSWVAGFINVEDREKQLIETERSILLQAISVIQRAAPQMEEISLLVDAVSQIDEPFLLAIVGEFNSGKSTIINALLGEKYLTEGVIPTTNEITFLCYSKYNSEEPQRCERHPDGQYVCYLPAPILNEMNIVDTPGTNVILQRQQRLTEEFIPRADLLLFVISADRPLTESEVAFLRYTQQWRKKVVFVLNKADLYRNMSELEEAISFIKENTRKLLNAENVILYPVSARSALEEKLSASSGAGKDRKESIKSESHWKNNSFSDFENFLYSFLDRSTESGTERMRLKLETPIAIADRILSSCESFVKQERGSTEQDLAVVAEIVDSVKEFSKKMEKESVTWRKRTSSLIETTKSRVLEIIESTLQISNIDIAASYMLKGEKSTMTSTTFRVQHDILGPAVTEAQKLLKEYALWLKSSISDEGKLYKESFENKWPSIINPNTQMQVETYGLLEKVDDHGMKVMENFSTDAASRLFEQEIREVYLGTFGGLGAAGLSASLLTSVLTTTLEDLMALGLCSAGGFVAISNFPYRKRAMTDKVSKIADGLAHEVEEAMQKDLSEKITNLENFVKTISKPYQEAAQQRLDELINVQNELLEIEVKLRTLQVEIQNLHVS